MPRISVLLAMLLLGFGILSNAQDFGPLGKFTMEEAEMKECSFDKDANAVVLLHEAFSYYDDQYKLITYYHVRIKILKDKGKDFADITIQFRKKDDFEYIDKIEGITLNPQTNGNVEVSNLEKKSIFTKKNNEYWGEVTFALPAVKVGSILEYTYRSTMKHYGGLEDWEFQWPIPVVTSKYKLVILPNAEFAYRVQKVADYPIKIIPGKDDGSISFEMNNIPGLFREPFMDARRDYVQKVIFQLSSYSGRGYREKYSNTWPDLAREMLMESSFGGQLDKDLAGTEAFINEVKGVSSQMDKMQKVYDYVRHNMAWNGIYSKYSGSGTKAAWNKKTGTNGEINLILINLLKSVGLQVDPILVSERDHGRVNTSYPFIDQFNTVYALVTIDSKKYYLDATNKYTPAHIIPNDILNTTGFVVNRKNSQLITITDDQFQYQENIIISGSLTPDGKLVGKARVESIDYARVAKLSNYESNKDKYSENTFARNIDGLTIQNFKVGNEDNDSLPFLQEFDFTLPLTSTGDYTLLDLNLFTGNKTNPFISNNRFSNINFGYRQYIRLSLLVDIPQGYIIDAIPKPIRVTDPDKNIFFQKQVTIEHGKLSANFNIEIRKALFEAEEYSTLKEFYKLMFDSLNEQVVLKKK